MLLRLSVCDSHRNINKSPDLKTCRERPYFSISSIYYTTTDEERIQNWSYAYWLPHSEWKRRFTISCCTEVIFALNFFFEIRKLNISGSFPFFFPYFSNMWVAHELCLQNSQCISNFHDRIWPATVQISSKTVTEKAFFCFNLNFSTR